jgi:hypothetical protein
MTGPGKPCHFFVYNMITTILKKATTLLTGLGILFLFNSCSKDIEEPKHKNKGRNFVYLKLDDTEHLIHDAWHLNKAARGSIWGYDDSDYKPRLTFSTINGKEDVSLHLGFRHKDYSPVASSWVNIHMVRDNGTLNLERLSLNLIAYSEKHKEKVDIWENDIQPRSFQIEEFDEKKQHLALSFLVDYRELSDTSKSGTLYFYMDVDYAK